MAMLYRVMLQANGGIERAVLDAYCWMYSSWNIPQEYKGACTGGDQVSQSVSQSPVCRLYFYVKWRSLLIKNMRVDLVLREIHSISFFFIFSSRCITAYVLNPSYNVKKLFKITFCKLKVFDTELLRALSQR